MGIRLRAGLKTLKGCVVVALAVAGVYAMLRVITVELLGLSIMASSLVVLVYSYYRMNLSQLEEQEIANLRSAEWQKYEQQLKSRRKQTP